MLTRLGALNTQRAAEEAQGQVRRLRPEYQAPDAVQTEADLVEHPEAVVEVTAVRNLLVIGPG